MCACELELLLACGRLSGVFIHIRERRENGHLEEHSACTHKHTVTGGHTHTATNSLVGVLATNCGSLSERRLDELIESSH